MENKTIQIQKELLQEIDETYDKIFAAMDEFEKDIQFYKLSRMSLNKYGGVRDL